MNKPTSLTLIALGFLGFVAILAWTVVDHRDREVWLCGQIDGHEVALEMAASGFSISNPNPAPVSIDMHLCATGERGRITEMNRAKAAAGPKN